MVAEWEKALSQNSQGGPRQATLGLKEKVSKLGVKEAQDSPVCPLPGAGKREVKKEEEGECWRYEARGGRPDHREDSAGVQSCSSSASVSPAPRKLLIPPRQ